MTETPFRSRGWRIARAVLVFAAITLVAPNLFAWERASPSVPPESGLYRDLDKLVAFSLVTPPIRGQRPYPRGEFARMTAEAMTKLSKLDEGDAESFEGFQHGRAQGPDDRLRHFRAGKLTSCGLFGLRRKGCRRVKEIS